jgi:hypothetical protein
LSTFQLYFAVLTRCFSVNLARSRCDIGDDGIDEIDLDDSTTKPDKDLTDKHRQHWVMSG